MTTIIQALGSNTTFFFHFGITYRQDDDAPGETKTITLKELLDGKQIHHVDPDGLEGWLKSQNGLIIRSWSTGAVRHDTEVPLQIWIDRMKTIGHDDDPSDDCWT